MNLLDLVDANVPERPVTEVKGFAEAVEAWSHAAWMLKKADSYREREVYNWLVVQQNLAGRNLRQFWWSCLLSGTSMPTSPDKGSVLAKMAQTPMVENGLLLDIATALGFVCMPVSYVNVDQVTSNPKNGYSEPKATKVVKEFASADFSSWSVEEQKALGGVGVDVYVLGPATIYSLDQHIAAADSNLEMFAGKNEQAFLALRLSLPTLRAMRTQLTSLNENVEVLWRNQRDHSHSIEQLKRSQAQLAAEVERMRRDMTEQIRQVRIAAEEALREQVRLRSAPASNDYLVPGDPLMFALKHGTSIRDRKATAYLGPCWGPDFDDIVASAISISSSAETRKRVGKLLEIWWNS